MCFCTERPPFRLWTCGLQCAECKDFSVCAGSQVERGNLRNSDQTFLLRIWVGARVHLFLIWQILFDKKMLMDKITFAAYILHI